MNSKIKIGDLVCFSSLGINGLMIADGKEYAKVRLFGTNKVVSIKKTALQHFKGGK